MFKITTWLALLFTALSAHAHTTTIDYGVVSATPIEAKPIRADLKNLKPVEINHITYWQGELHGHSIMTVTSGMGRVPAAAITALLIQNFHPKEIIFVGVAGGLQQNTKIGDVVISTRLDNAQHYIFNGPIPRSYLSPNTEAVNPAHFYPSKILLKQAHRLHLPFPLYFGPIVSTDNFPGPASNIKRFVQNGDMAAESEGVAIAQISEIFHTPWLVIRGISNESSYFDKSGQLHHAQTVSKTVLAAQNAATAFKKLASLSQ